MLNSLIGFLRKNKKTIFLFFGITFLFFIDFDVSFADEAEDGLTIGANSLMRILATLLGLLTAFVSLFMQPEWVNGTYINMDIYMKQVWILVSNVVYFAFAFLLIFIAFVNIIGKGQEKFGLKQALPKFIVGILIVPFSWFMVQFMISLSGVLTIGALTLPYELFSENTDFEVYQQEVLKKAEVCTNFKIHLGQIVSEKTVAPGDVSTVTAPEEKLGDGFYCKDPKGKRTKVWDIISGINEDGDTSVFGMISLYTYGILGLEDLNNITADGVTLGGLKSLLSLGVKGILNLIFILVFLILLIALFISLLVRIMYIWIFTMLSPLFGLSYFFGGKLSSEGFMSKFNFKEFFGLVMMPVYVGLALSFGFMFLMVTSHGLNQGELLKGHGDVADGETVPLQIGIITIELVGTLNNTGPTEDGEAPQLSHALKTFNGAGGALGEMIMIMFSIGILWVSVMAALRSSDLTKGIVDPIYNFGNQVGKLAASAPLHAPIIPTKGGQTTSLLGVSKGINRIKSDFANRGNVAADAFADQYSPFRSEASKVTSESRQGNTAVSPRDKMEFAQNAVKAATSTSMLSGNKEFIKLLKQIGEDLKVPDSKDLEVNMPPDAFARIFAQIEKAVDSSSVGGYQGMKGFLKDINMQNKDSGIISTGSGLSTKLKENNNGSSNQNNVPVSQSSQQATTKILGANGKDKIEFNTVNNIDFSKSGLDNNSELNKILTRVQGLSKDDRNYGNIENTLRTEGVTPKKLNKLMDWLDTKKVFTETDNK